MLAEFELRHVFMIRNLHVERNPRMPRYQALRTHVAGDRFITFFTAWIEEKPPVRARTTGD
jgi:hypothetical protein